LAEPVDASGINGTHRIARRKKSRAKSGKLFLNGSFWRDRAEEVCKSMYAIIKTGGKQYSVERGDRLFVEKLDVEPGARIEFDKVLYLNADDFTKVGTPYLDAVRVIGTAVENGKAKKVVTFKYKAKKHHRKKQGHRQPYTLVEIDSITADGEVLGGKAEETALEQGLPAEDPNTEERAGVATDADEAAEVESEETGADEAAKPEADETGADSAATPADKQAEKRPVKPKAEKTDADDAATPADKQAAKKTAKPKAEKTDADGDATSADKQAAKRTAKPKAEKTDADDAATPAEKSVARRTAKPRVEAENTEGTASAAPEEEK
jgi:large subunit ribosomal protein L21